MFCIKEENKNIITWNLETEYESVMRRARPPLALPRAAGEANPTAAARPPPPLHPPSQPPEAVAERRPDGAGAGWHVQVSAGA